MAGSRGRRRGRDLSRGRVLLDRNDSPFGVPQPVLDAWERQRTADPRKYGLNRYGDFFQTDMLSAMQRYHGLTPLSFTPLAGVGETGTVLAAALLRKGGEVVQSWPIDDPISPAARGWGGRLTRVPLTRDFRQDLEALGGAVGPDTKLVHVQNPHDPSGTSFGQADLEHLLAAVAARNADTYVWVDEQYADYARRSDFPRSYELIGRDPTGSRLIVSRTLQRACGIDAAPVGYLASSTELAHETEGFTNGFFAPDKTSFGWANAEAGVNRMSEKAILALLSPDGDNHSKRVSALNLEGRRRLVAMLESHGFDVVPSDASFVLAQPPRGRYRKRGLAKALRERKVWVRSSKGWGPRYHGFVRVSVGNQTQLDRLEKALGEVLRRRPSATSGAFVSHAVTKAPRKRATDRRTLLSAGAAGAAGLVGPPALKRIARLGISTPEPDGMTRRQFARVAAYAAGGATVLGAAMARSPAARAFPPDSFYDTFDLARMIYHENPVGPSPAGLDAVKQVLRGGPLAARRRQDTDQADLVAEILRYNALRRRSVRKLSAKNVMLLLGSAEGLFLSADTFVAGGTIVSEWPSYRIIRERVWQGRGTVVDVQLDPKTRKPDYEAMKRALKANPDTGLVHFNIQNNPMGTVVERGEFDAFAQYVFANHPKAVIVADESDTEYMDPGQAGRMPDFPAYVARGRRLIHIQTFSHGFGLTGLRVGYLFAAPQLIDALRRKRIPRPTNVFGHAAALAALRDWEAQIRRSFSTVHAGREYLYSELDKMGLRYSRSQGQYVMVDTGVDGSLVWAALISQGVLTREGREWGHQSWLRVNPGLDDENRRFIAALRAALSRPDVTNPPTHLPIPVGDFLPGSRRGRALATGLQTMHDRNVAIEARMPAFDGAIRTTPAGALGL